MAVRLRALLVGAIVVAMAATCVRLGVWQLSRWHEKQRLNAALNASLAAPPLVIGDAAPPAGAVGRRRVRAQGVYDETHQFVLAGRASNGSPGVDVVTPLLLPGGGAVLVDRGWLYAADAATANPLAWPEPGPRTVVGLAQPLAGVRMRVPLRRLPYGHDSAAVWSAMVVDPDTAARRLGRPVAGWLLRALPAADAPPQPVRSAPRPYDELMHISYAVQWFAFATILVVGSLALAWTRRRQNVPPRP